MLELAHYKKNSLKFKKTWLISLLLATLSMLSLGGLTRLTNSGLSIVDWKLVKGMQLPLSHQQWNSQFQKYQQFPEYKTKNKNFSLQNFKSIFLMEYFHRMLGRFIGLLTLLPFLFLLWKKQLRKKEIFHFFSLFTLVSIQGLVGWYMVQSGLINRPAVSHYRLALHLALALAFLAYILLLLLNYFPQIKSTVQLSKLNQISLHTLFALLCLQLFFGALQAGLDAGLVSNSYPKMLGKWIPANALFHKNSWWQNALENPFFIHFFHRHLGIIVASGLILFTLTKIPKTKNTTGKIILALTLLATILTPILGILTTLNQITLWSAALHQLLAASLFLLLLLLLVAAKPKTLPNP